MTVTAVRFHPTLEPLLVPIEEVGQYPGNPRNGDIEMIAESILVNGMYQPIVAQRSTGHILAGNHRYAALLSLGETRIPVVWVDVDDAEARRIALADNRTSDLARYDDALLLELLEALGNEETALLGTGYTPGDVEDLLRHLSAVDLDQLNGDYGDANDEDLWPWIRIQAPPAVADRFWAALERFPGNAPPDRLAALLDRLDGS